MTAISIKALLERAHSKPQSYPLKDGTAVLIRKMSAAEAEDYFESQQQDVNGKKEFVTRDARAKLIALCVTDDDGGRVKLEDARALENDLSTELADLCRKHNGMDAKVEEVKKDSPPTDGGSGSSSSPAPSAEPSQS